MPLLRRRHHIEPHPNVCVSAVSSYLHVYQQGLSHKPQDLSCLRHFLKGQLELTKPLGCDLPPALEQLPAWAYQRQQMVIEQFSQYRQAREQGKGRQYFPSKAHALEFLRTVAPTKLVDGAWLYGTLKLWQHSTLQPLIATYLDEIGNGDVAQNHVLIYQRLLRANGCPVHHDLADQYYQQGAIQLALGHLGSEFTPEVLGFNLGYEQLPLHLLICTYELEELGIDPHYFRLHITIDNASTGHAQQAIAAVLNNLPLLGDRTQYYQRVRHGYLLNELGLGSIQVIARLDLKQAVVEMLERKRLYAQGVHTERCRIEGKTINQWLALQNGMGDFLDALERCGWLKLGQLESQSRFWQLISTPSSVMFGVFNSYELQLLKDLIRQGVDAACERPSRPVTRDGRDTTAIHPEALLLRRALRGLNHSAQMQRLIELLGPGTHSKPAGLYAAQLFNRLYGAG